MHLALLLSFLSVIFEQWFCLGHRCSPLLFPSLAPVVRYRAGLILHALFRTDDQNMHKAEIESILDPVPTLPPAGFPLRR